MLDEKFEPASQVGQAIARRIGLGILSVMLVDVSGYQGRFPRLARLRDERGQRGSFGIGMRLRLR